jgi:ABC-type Mn2+/Zn2+ transport system permease subunit
MGCGEAADQRFTVCLIGHEHRVTSSPSASYASAVVSASSAVSAGASVVLRRMSYIGQGLSQSVLGGVAPAVLSDIDPYLGAVAATVVAGLLISYVGRQHGVRPDAAIGIVSTTMFAGGVALVSANRDRAVNLTDLLFGNILGVTGSDLALVAVVDGPAASAHGVRAATVEMAFTIALAAAVVVSIRIVGVLLIAAVIVIPASTARIFGRSLGPLVAVAACLGMAASVVGMFASFHLEIASGPAIVLASSTGFAGVLVASTIAAAIVVRRARAEHAGQLVADRA